MAEQNVGKAEQDFEMHKVTPSDSLWSVAYDHVLPPHSDPSVARCLNNILETNGGKFGVNDWVKIPKPCDPEDGPIIEEQKAKQQLNDTATNFIQDFKTHEGAYSAAWDLSDELYPRLKSLDTPNREYNYLLEKIYKGMENEPFTDGVRIGAEHWNSTTHTWDNVYVADKDYPNSPPARIVQPDNTIGQIVDDRIQQLRNQGRHVDSGAYRREFMDRNYLNSQNDLDAKVGRPVLLPY